MGTKGWTFSTFVGCCIWILHGLRAATAVPVTTEGMFAEGTDTPIAVETEGPHSLVMGTAETSTVMADAEITESIPVGSPASPSFPPGDEPGALVTAASDYGSTVPTPTNVTKPLNISQDNEGGSSAPTAATTAATISAQHPAVTPDAELDVTEATPSVTQGATPPFVNVEGDVLAPVTKEGADVDPATGAVSLPITPPPAAAWGAQPTADSPVGTGVTTLPSQGPTTAMGAAEEGVTLPEGIQSETRANSLSPNPSAGELPVTQQDGAVSEAEGITPEPPGETALGAEEIPSASVPGDAGDAVNGASSTVGSSHPPLESVTVSGTVGNPGEPSLLGPAVSLAPADHGDGDGQGAPGESSDTAGSALLLAGSEATAVTGDTATSLLAPAIPTGAQSDTNLPALATVPPADNGAETPVSPDVGAAPGAPLPSSLGGSQAWGTEVGAPQGDDGPGTGLTSAGGIPSSTSSGLAGPPSPALGDQLGTNLEQPAVEGHGAGATVLGGAGSGTESEPSLGSAAGSGTAAGVDQLPGAGSSSGPTSPSDLVAAPSISRGDEAGPIPDTAQGHNSLPPSSLGSETGPELAPAQDNESTGDAAQAGNPESGSPDAETAPAASSTQQNPSNAGELPAGETGSLANAELSPPSALGDGAGAAPPLGDMSSPGPAPPGSAGLESDLSGAEGPGDLPGESPGAPGDVHPPPGAAAGPGSAAETPVSPDLGAAPGAPIPPPLEGSQPWETAAGAPQGAGPPGANGSGTGLTSAGGIPSSTSSGLAGPPSPSFEDQLGTNLEQPAVEGHGAGATVLGGAGSGTESGSSLGSAAGSGTAAGVDQLPGAGSSSGPTSPSDLVAAPSISRGDEAGPIPDTAQGHNSLPPSSLGSETGPELAPAQDNESTGDAAQAGNPESESPDAETAPAASSTQQNPSNAGELPAGETGSLANAELSPPSALGDGAGAAPPLGDMSSPGPAPPGSAGLESDLSGAEGPGDLPGESPGAPGDVHPPPGAAAGPGSAAETPVSPDLGAAPGAPIPPPLEGSQPWETAAGAPQGAGPPGANGSGTGLTSAGGIPSSTSSGLAGPPSPSFEDQLGTNLEQPAVEGHGAGATVLGGAGSGTESGSSLGSAAGSGTAAGVDQLPGAGSSSGPTSPSDLVAAPSISRGDEAGPIPDTAQGHNSLPPSSLGSETGPELAPAQDNESTGDAAQAGNPESESPDAETAPAASSTQQNPSNAGELPAGETGSLANAELSPPSALGDGAGAAPPLGDMSSPGPAPPGSAGLESDLSGAEGPGDLPGESPGAPGDVHPPPGAAAGPGSAAETPVSPDLGAAPGAPIPSSLEGSQPWETAAGAPQGAGPPGANGSGTGLTSAGGIPSSTSSGLAGPPSPSFEDQLGTNLEQPAVEGHGAGATVLGGAGSGTESEPSLGSAAGSGMAAGVDQLPGAGSSSGPASPSGVVAAPSVSDPASPGALGGAGSAPGVSQPSLGTGSEVPSAAGEGAGEVAGDGGSPGQAQAPVGGASAGPGAPDGETGAVLPSSSSSTSTEGSSSPGTAGEADKGASLPGAGGASGGLSTGLEAAGPKEPSVPAPSTQHVANLGLSDAKLSQVNVVELPGGASVNRGPSPGASLGEGAGAITQITSGALAPSAIASPQGTQPLAPVAPDGNSVSDSTATSLATSLLLPGHGLSSEPAPSGDTLLPPSTQSGSRAPVPGAQGGLAGDSGSAQTWSLEDEVASGMPAPSEEASPHVPAPPNTAPVLPSSSQEENSAEEPSASPRPSAPLSARELIVGSSAGARGELGAAALGGPALLLPTPQPGSPGAPSRDAESPMAREVSARLPGAMAGRGDMAWLLPSATEARAGVETTARSPLAGSPGLPGLPPASITAGSSGSKSPEPGPAGGSSPAALQPFLGSEMTTSLANQAPAAGGSRLSAAFSGQGGAQGVSPATVRPAVSCSPATASPAPPALLPEGREVLPRPGAATVTSHASSPVFPAPPEGPVAAPTPLPGPTVPAVPLYGYGTRENDREYVERRVDFNSPLFKPETGFPFGKTLRDSLYFTDNGQIIFPASDNSIFTYPNPPPGGFNGHEGVPMIAVFWDNADFSRGVGTTYYQEFLTLNTDKPPFIRDVEGKVRRYLRSSYSAVWTLKITWEKAPAYAARTDTRRTSTYQAILTTDGFRSYVLMLYQEGGMGWDYTRLAAPNVLIGYTSGDGSYRNDDLTRRPPAAKYRPDQFRGYNTDLRGLWIYKLESRVGINYRIKCLAWTGQQQEPRTWSQGLPDCPCSLQQGQQDPRFKSSRRGWWAARVSMLHSASPNQHGAGVRCMYDSQSQLIEGRQERYWRSSRQASPYRDQELKLYDWCCNQPGSAHLCARYSEKRPKISCDGYQSPGTAGSSEEAESDSEEQRDGEDK